jgi:hypothetical protein
VPHPASEPSEHVILVEGPPDMIAARSAHCPRSQFQERAPGRSRGHGYSWAGE